MNSHYFICIYKKNDLLKLKTKFLYKRSKLKINKTKFNNLNNKRARINKLKIYKKTSK